MTRKHFIEIAAAIKDLRGNVSDDHLEMFIDTLCSVFRDLNPRFDSIKFKNATK